MNDEKLVLLVQANECLYNKQCMGYKLAEKKKRVWQQISTEMKVPEDIVVKRWACLRDRYAREKRQETLPSGSGRKIKSQWPLMQTMEFIAPYVVPRAEFIPENNLPLGVDFYGNRIFITTPRWKDGVPASFGYLNYPPLERSPAIKPYPNWESHGDPYNPNCSKLISVYRTFIDGCNRIWLIDSGIVNATVSLNQICPPKIVAYDLHTNELVVRYNFPPSQIKEDSLHSNIVVDVFDDQCDDAHAYVTDVWRFGIVVYSLRKNRSWRVTNYNFSPDPIASDFNVYGLNFQWLDGVFGMSLALPQQSTKERVLYFHPMASFKEFMVSTKFLKDESLWLADAQKVAKYFVPIGERGKFGQSSTSGITQNGVMFFTQVHRDDIGCWDTSKSYGTHNIHRFFENTSYESLIQFPNDLKVDHEINQNVWIMSNRLPIYLYGELNYNEINFRILKANAADLIAGTICDPLTSPAFLPNHNIQC